MSSIESSSKKVFLEKKNPVEQICQKTPTISVVLLLISAIGASITVAVITLSFEQVFGPIGTIGYICAISGGGAAGLISVGMAVSSIILIAVNLCKTKENLFTEFPSNNPGEELENFELFTQEFLSSNPGEEFPPSALQTYTYKPVNKDIETLFHLYENKYLPAFEAAIKQSDNPWQDPTLLKAADELIRISYTISKLTLEDIPSLVEEVQKLGNTTALTSENSYTIRTYFIFPEIYHSIRGGMIWDPDRSGFILPPEEDGLEFYTPTAIQSQWRKLYNSFSRDVRQNFDCEWLAKNHPEFIQWTQFDTPEEPFIIVPGSLPYQKEN